MGTTGGWGGAGMAGGGLGGTATLGGWGGAGIGTVGGLVTIPGG